MSSKDIQNKDFARAVLGVLDASGSESFVDGMTLWRGIESRLERRMDGLGFFKGIDELIRFGYVERRLGESAIELGKEVKKTRQHLDANKYMAASMLYSITELGRQIRPQTASSHNDQHCEQIFTTAKLPPIRRFLRKFGINL